MIRGLLKSVVCQSFALVWMTWLTFGTLSSSVDAAELLVADLHGDPYSEDTVGRVVAFDPTTGAYIRTVVSVAKNPSSMVIGPKGYLYVANQLTGEVLAYDPAGQDAKINDGTIVNGIFASGLNGPGGLLYDSASDTLFVSEIGSFDQGLNFDGELVKQFDANKNLLNTIGAGTGGGGRTGMALDADGNLYVGVFSSGNILKFSGNDFSSDSVFATGAFGASQLLFRGTDLLVAAQLWDFVNSNGAVAQFDSDGNALTPLVTGLSFNSGLYIDSNGDLLVTELGDGPNPGRIGKYNLADGTVINADFISGFDTPDGFILPSAMLLSPVPEPGAIALALGGFAILIGIRAKRRMAISMD